MSPSSDNGSEVPDASADLKQQAEALWGHADSVADFDSAAALGLRFKAVRLLTGINPTKFGAALREPLQREKPVADTTIRSWEAGETLPGGPNDYVYSLFANATPVGAYACMVAGSGFLEATQEGSRHSRLEEFRQAYESESQRVSEAWEVHQHHRQEQVRSAMRRKHADDSEARLSSPLCRVEAEKIWQQASQQESARVALGRQLHAVRTMLNMTQPEMTQGLQSVLGLDTPIPPESYGRWERGMALPAEPITGDQLVTGCIRLLREAEANRAPDPRQSWPEGFMATGKPNRGEEFMQTFERAALERDAIEAEARETLYRRNQGLRARTREKRAQQAERHQAAGSRIEAAAGSLEEAPDWLQALVEPGDDASKPKRGGAGR